MPRSTKTSPQRIRDRERMTKALNLRKAGASYQQIADQLHYNDRSAAHHAVTTALKQLIQEPGEDVLLLELARLDDLTTAVWRKAITGDPKAIDTALRISERRSKLQGLDEAENRIAGALERSATADERQTQMLFIALQGILLDLNLTPEQEDAAPAIVAHHLREVERQQQNAATTL